jgi:hypothetical protein
MKNVGFTGTQRGMTELQMAALRAVLRQFEPGEFHHGDCIGADDEAAQVAALLEYTVHRHPPTDPSKRAYAPYDVEWPAKPYLVRNQEIVDASEVLIAAPKSKTEEVRSGTWATIRYARKLGRDLYIIWPNGGWDAEAVLGYSSGNEADNRAPDY